jgi:hypothetical protein
MVGEWKEGIGVDLVAVEDESRTLRGSVPWAGLRCSRYEGVLLFCVHLFFWR